MDVVSVRIDPDTKGRMAHLTDVSWAEVIREAIRDRVELEEELRRTINRRRALRGTRGIDAIRQMLAGSCFDSTREIRKWRESRK